MRHYIVGIDLGTTHTVVAYAQLNAQAGPAGGAKGAAPGAIQLFEIEQLVSPGQWAALPLLPSVRYHAGAGELAPGELQLPWPQADTDVVADADADADVEAEAAGPAHIVFGQWARQLGAQVPGRLVSSAKSWLSHPTVDRLAAILPWGAPADVPKVSPVAASASYLRYVRAAWDWKFPGSPLVQQELVLTVPASFDEGARALTLSAARQAGLTQLRLLEEPQAVFYDWLSRHRDRLATELAQTRLVLVCDVGGGTTDLSLIKVELLEGQPQLTRIGVGNHLMLGGDNMDLALAHVVETRMAASAPAPATATATAQAVPRLSASQLAQLMDRCRVAKELLLAADAPEQVPVTLLGEGSRLVGGSRSVTLTRAEVEHLIVDGFFPRVEASAQAQQARSGIVAFGLPYARDPAITRHIADFLRQHAQAMPDTLLLNGGVFRADALVKRLEQTLSAWCGAPLRLLHNDNPDVAVARGAVAYALSQHGLAPKIGGGSARSYFLLLEDASDSVKKRDPGAAAPSPRGICILPRCSKAGQEVLLAGRSFALRLGQPVRFHLFSSVADAADHRPFELGELLRLDDEKFVRLPPIAIVLKATTAGGTRAGALNGIKDMPVQLLTALTEVGTLEMHCVSLSDTSQRWRLEFDLRQQDTPSNPTDDSGRNSGGADRMASVRLAEAIEKINRIFGPGTQPVAAKEVKQLRAHLEHILGERERWATPELRQLFDALWARARGRRRSAEHERVWLNLAGYCLRPGFGYALDEWRMQQLWTLFPSGVQFGKDKQVCAEWWTLWRRVAGGLGAPEQLRLLDDFAYNLQANELGTQISETRPVKGSDEDMLRLGASLERIPVAYKVEIGEWLLGRLEKSAAAAKKRGSDDPASDGHTLWALGRIGARQPFYGNTHDVVPAETAAVWIDSLLALDWKRIEPAAFAATHLARATDDRARDLPLALREQIIQKLLAIHAPPIWAGMVRQRVELDAATERRVLGESLPPGLKLMV
ncbi:Hsp70 family protein [Rhodoferax ferrireducens]|uniref:Hsp70 family protein n=1 Tax=Rhodoferax ferrireducens TaxID=192843 RepID=UPI000E0D1CAE|nr:Hsp70 family protein [Rhodoferax ferrireducens]